MKLAGISRPVAFTRNEIELYLQRTVQLTDWAPSRLATEAGLAPSTINRFLAGKKGPLLSATTLGKIEAVAADRIMQRVRAGEINPGDLWSGHASRAQQVPTNRSSSEWPLPESSLRIAIRGGAFTTLVVDSRDLEPFLYIGDRVFIDTNQRAIVPGATFAIKDGKRVVLRQHPRKNTRVIGRVVGMLRSI